jgi:hypothetical protein
MASSQVFIFCAPGLVLGVTEGVISRFYIFRSLTRVRRYRGHQVSFLYFALPDLFWAVPRSSGPVFMFCSPRLISSGTEGVDPNFHVSRPRDSFSAVLSASGTVFMFCAPGLIFRGTEGVESHFHVWRFRAHFRRYRG